MEEEKTTDERWETREERNKKRTSSSEIIISSLERVGRKEKREERSIPLYQVSLFHR